MKEMLEQWTKNMGKMWDPWQKMMTDADWMKTDASHQIKWSAWLSAMRSSCEVSVTWWQMFLTQTEEIFFRTYKDSPFHNKAVEDRIREFGENIKKAQKIQTDSVKEYLDKMEAALKDTEPTR